MSDRDQIVELLARYVRAMSDRDGATAAGLFAPHGTFALFSRRGRDAYVARGAEIVGPDNIAAMIDRGTMPAQRGMHYLTTDHIVDVTGDCARLQAQFLAVEVDADASAQAEWTVGARLLSGVAVATMLGAYDSQLQRIDGRWLFTAHHVKHSLPLRAVSTRN